VFRNCSISDQRKKEIFQLQLPTLGAQGGFNN